METREAENGGEQGHSHRGRSWGGRGARRHPGGGRRDRAAAGACGAKAEATFYNYGALRCLEEGAAVADDALGLVRDLAALCSAKLDSL